MQDRDLGLTLSFISNLAVRLRQDKTRPLYLQASSVGMLLVQAPLSRHIVTTEMHNLTQQCNVT